MVPKPLPMNANYLAAVHGIRELHKLLVAGNEDSPEADAVRDACDRPWEALSDDERTRVSNLSEDLYSLTEPPPLVQSVTDAAQDNLKEAVEARKRGDWDRALELLRQCRPHLDAALVSFHRGAVWLAAGDVATALLFLEHAAKLCPTNGSYLALYLHTFAFADPPAALQKSEEVLRVSDSYPPMAVFYAADVVLTSAYKFGRTESVPVARRLIPVLKSILARMDEGEDGSVERCFYAKTTEMLGLCLALIGESQAAMDWFTEVLRTDPLLPGSLEPCRLSAR